MKKWIYTFCVIGFVLTSQMRADNTIDLSGQWQLTMDPAGDGDGNSWREASTSIVGEVTLPGSIQEQGYGNPVGPETKWMGSIRYDQWDQSKYAPYRTAENFKMPFWLQPERYYMGKVGFSRKVTIPQDWNEQHITLCLERPHWETTVFVDGKEVGKQNFLSVPHVYDLSGYLTPVEHTLLITVDNREIIPVGINSHSISDHTQSNWNGVVGQIALRCQPRMWMEELWAYPDLEKREVRISYLVRTMDQFGPFTAKVAIFRNGKLIFSDDHSYGEFKDRDGNPSTRKQYSFDYFISLDKDMAVWDEFSPALYTAIVTINWDKEADTLQTKFAMREIKTKKNQFMLNGTPMMFRGTLECCIFPETGYPPTDVASWKRIINICKDHGLNHIRFHSWCPPEAAFVAADELGFYFQVECSSWANYGSTGIGNGKSVDKWLYDEARAIRKAYGTHPSFMLLAYGNEPAGPESGATYLREWVKTQTKFPDVMRRFLVTSGSGWPLIEESEYHDTPTPRIQAWGEALNSRINSKPAETVTDYRDFVKRYPEQPVISHEIGQWCVYPDFDEMKKYTGVLKAKNFEIFKQFLKDKWMLGQARDFLMASGKLQVLCYKEEIESTLRTPHFGGFQLLDLHDFPGQGSALVGVLDPFWDSKPYVTPAEYHRFAGPVVPLVRMEKRIFRAADSFKGQLDLSQFGDGTLRDTQLNWALKDSDGKAVREGTFKIDSLAAGGLYTIGAIEFDFEGLDTPAKYNLDVSLADSSVGNDWDIWVYPDVVNDTLPDNVLIASSIDDKAMKHVQQGGKLLLAIEPKLVKTDVVLGFSSIFWNTAWTQNQPPHTLGVLCDPKHPALSAFPTEYHSNWQWSDLIRHGAAMELDFLPADVKPIVQIVPDWFEPQKLGLVFEGNVGKGSILVCSVDIVNDLDKRLEARQMRTSLLEYMGSTSFNPSVEITMDELKGLFREPTTIERLGGKVYSVDSYEPGYEGINAIDGDPSTMWHTEWSNSKPGHWHEIIIRLDAPEMIKGLKLLPRQDGNLNGMIKEYMIYTKRTDFEWDCDVIQGELEQNANEKILPFPIARECQYVRLLVLSGFGDDPFTSIAELDLIESFEF